MKRVVCCVAALALVCQAAGCCRMCCWQHGGSWSNGQCYAPQPIAAPVAGAPYTVVPQTTVPYTVAPQSTAPAVLPQTTAPTMVPQQTFIPVNPCTCTCN